jgi:hypothetical protein
MTRDEAIETAHFVPASSGHAAALVDNLAALGVLKLDDHTVAERIEANADLVLWCVHVIGPDDVHAQPSHAHAVAKADELNRALWSRADGPDDLLCFAYADVWPWSAEAHAASLKQPDN